MSDAVDCVKIMLLPKDVEEGAGGTTVEGKTVSVFDSVFEILDAMSVGRHVTLLSPTEYPSPARSAAANSSPRPTVMIGQVSVPVRSSEKVVISPSSNSSVSITEGRGRSSSSDSSKTIRWWP